MTKKLGTVLAVALATVALLPFGCGLSTEGKTEHKTGQPCDPEAGDGACQGDDACSVGKCGADGLCTVTPREDGYELSDPARGDCKKSVCNDGKTTEALDEEDAEDDDNPCTKDVCSSDGLTTHEKMSGVACTLHENEGTCEAGTCEVSCTTGDDCKAASTCIVTTCDAATNLCVFQLRDGIETPGAPQPEGDCHTRVCRRGEDVDQVDSSDVPVTQNTCDEELCEEGTPKNPPRARNAPCSDGGGTTCDGAGHCVTCNDDGQCPGGTAGCVVPACENHECTTKDAAKGKLVGAQTDGDCKKHVCDGEGNEVDATDDTDHPNDSNDCTNDFCTGSMPGHSDKPLGTPCGSGSQCNAQGGCGCDSHDDCRPPNYVSCLPSGICGCNAQSCGDLGKTCGTATTCGSDIGCDDNQQNGSETDKDCGGDTTKCDRRCAVGQKCSVNADCANNHCFDGFCCDSGGCNGCLACSAAKKGMGLDGICGAIASGTDPHNACTDQGAASCEHNGSCDGMGDCDDYPNGTVCNPATCSGSTVVKADKCAGGACGDGGTQDCAPFGCASGACKGKCEGDGDCASTAYCDAEVCVTKKNDGLACDAANECDSGKCVDGVCCATDCEGTCMRCDGPTAGTCSAMPSGREDHFPVGACEDPDVCDGGSGPSACVGDLGAVCSVPGDCLSDHCAPEGVCCNTDCAGACVQCSTGTCSNIPRYTDDGAVCTGTNTCDGAGACLSEDGETCEQNANCASHNCDMSVCEP